MNKLDFLEEYGIPDYKIEELSGEDYWDSSIWDYNEIFDNFDESLARENFEKLLEAGLPPERLADLLSECDQILFSRDDITLEYLQDFGFDQSDIKEIFGNCDPYILAEYITNKDEVAENIEQLLEDQSHEEALELLVDGGVL